MPGPSEKARKRNRQRFTRRQAAPTRPVTREKAARGAPPLSTAVPGEEITPKALDHPQGVTALRPGLAVQLVHEGTHKEHSPATHSDLARVQVWHIRQVERVSLVKDTHFNLVEG